MQTNEEMQIIVGRQLTEKQKRSFAISEKQINN